MAPTKIIHSKSFFLFFLLALFTYSTSSLPRSPQETKITLYSRVSLTGPNINAAAVAGIYGNRWSPTNFATVYAIDETGTESLSPNSPIIARFQGIYSVSSVNGSSAYVTKSLVFISNAYAGSTLEIHGRLALNANVSEMSVPSGTGIFRFAKGYATVTTIEFNSNTVVSRNDITVLT